MKPKPHLEKLIFYVYALVDPRDRHFFYIGSCTFPACRLTSHIAESRNGYGHDRGEKIREIIASANTPEIQILKTVRGMTNARKAEMMAMEKYPQHLTNRSYPISEKRRGRKHRISLTRLSNVLLYMGESQVMLRSGMD